MNPDLINKPVVLHIFTSLGFGGVEKRGETIAAYQQHARWEHVFYAIDYCGDACEKIRSFGAVAHGLSCSPKIPNMYAIAAIFRVIKKIKPNVIHTHGAEANFHGLIAAWLAGVPIRIGEEIGIPNHSALAKKVFRQVYRLSHRVVCISNAVKDWLINNNEVPVGKAVRIYNPVELYIPEEQLRGPEHIFRIGFVGRLEPVKNPLALVEAVARLRDENVPVELWIVGDGSQRAELEKRIEKHALQKNARLFGYRKNPIDYVSQCDLYVQPSLSEGFGIALVEAMGCGVPVLATSVGGAPEIITHGETGWLIDQPDASGLYKALIKIWRQRQNLPAIGVAGRLAVQGRFEPTAYIEELDFLYSSLLAGKPQEIAN